MDPSARFDDEVARIARENDADVVFQLVEREDWSMSQCYVHDTPEPATHHMMIEEPGQEPQHIEVCKDHGIWLNTRDLTEQPPNTDKDRVEDLRPAIDNPGTRITGGRIPPPRGNERDTIERPPPNFGRDMLVVRCGLGAGGTPPPRLPSGVERLPREEIIELVGVVHFVLEVFRVVVVADTLGCIAEHLGRWRTPEGIVQLVSTVLSDLGPGGHDGLAASGQRRIGPISALPQILVLTDNRT
jgi:hypothetical protein